MASSDDFVPGKQKADSVLPASEIIQHAQNLPVDFGNQILYRMCADYPYHSDVDVVGGKIWLIGRAYAASLERKKPQGISTNNLYRQVTQALVASDIDAQLSYLRETYAQPLDARDSEAVDRLLNLHDSFVNLVTRYTQIDKRSLASKYLHFHLPSLIYIYDSRASSALRAIYPRLSCKQARNTRFDYPYHMFYLKMLKLRDDIGAAHNIWLNPRQMDNLLLSL
ncbi:MAG: hypothetical protein U0694_26090 [Anaerolineae bacterium]